MHNTKRTNTAARNENTRLSQNNFQADLEFVSAFTVAELGEMLPRYLQVGGYSHELRIVRSSVWRFYYGYPKDGQAYVYFTADNNDIEANARAKMLSYLIENGFIV